MIFRHLPILRHEDTTHNFEQLQAFVPTLVSTLPTVASDGQEVYYQNAAMAAQAVVWRFRYHANSGNPNKWEFVGGSPLRSGPTGEKLNKETEAEEELPSGPTLTLPRTGRYEVWAGNRLMTMTAAGAINLELTLRVAGVAIFAGLVIASAQFGGSSVFVSEPIEGTAGQVLTMGIRQNHKILCNYYAGTILLTPARVS